MNDLNKITEEMEKDSRFAGCLVLPALLVIFVIACIMTVSPL